MTLVRYIIGGAVGLAVGLAGIVLGAVAGIFAIALLLGVQPATSAQGRNEIALSKPARKKESGGKSLARKKESGGKSLARNRLTPKQIRARNSRYTAKWGPSRKPWAPDSFIRARAREACEILLKQGKFPDEPTESALFSFYMAAGWNAEKKGYRTDMRADLYIEIFREVHAEFKKHVDKSKAKK